MTVLRTLVAPTASMAKTTGGGVLGQSGLPNPVTRLLTSKLKNAPSST
jgi:hypothetical protein